MITFAKIAEMDVQAVLIIRHAILAKMALS
jgi:hypothetical protein